MKTIRRKILLNPGPGTTSRSVKEAMVVEDICPREKEFGDLADGIKNDLVRIVHGENDYVAVLFAASGTGAMEAAVTSAVPKRKKLLVVVNGAYGTRMVNIAKTYGIGVVEYKIPYGDYPVLDDIRFLIEENRDVSHLALIHHETTTGMLNPVSEIVDLAHRYNVEIIIDSISAYAGLPIDIKKLDAEYLISSSNKCIQGMSGLSFVILKKVLLEKIKANKRSFYFDIYSQYTGFNKSRQMQFTPPIQVMYALRQAIDEYFKETEEGRASRYEENWQLLYNGLKEMGFRFLLPYNQESHILIAVHEPTDKNYSFEVMHDYFYERGYTIYPGKEAKEATFRLAVIGDLHREDILNFLTELENYLLQYNITL